MNIEEYEETILRLDKEQIFHKAWEIVLYQSLADYIDFNNKQQYADKLDELAELFIETDLTTDYGDLHIFFQDYIGEGNDNVQHRR